MLISLVIPVYNVEKYIRECVDSIVSQDFSDYEIILVDDGSLDTSGEICDEYAEKYNFISVIHKINGGLSDARNTGINAACGDYILFVDSDDYIAEGALKKISESVKNNNNVVDVVFLEAFKVFPDGDVVSLGDGYNGKFINGQPKKIVMEHIAALPKYPGSACTKLIRRTLITDNDMYFGQGLLSEDIDWTLSLLMKSEVFSYCDAPYYYYRQDRTGSITSSVGVKHINDLIYIINKWSSRNTNDLYHMELNAFMAYQYIVLLYNFENLTKEDKKVVRGDVKSLAWVLKYGRTKKTKLVYLCYKILGMSVTGKLLVKIRQK